MRLSLIYSLFIVPYFLCCNLSKSEEIDKILPYFQIFTTINKSFEKVDTKILKNCEIDKYFQLKNEKNKGNIYDDSSIFRRVLRFHLNTPQKNRTSTKKQLNIEISSKIEGGAGEVIIPKNKFVLSIKNVFVLKNEHGTSWCYSKYPFFARSSARRTAPPAAPRSVL